MRQNGGIESATCFMENFRKSLIHYRSEPKFSDRYVWANSADPDQTAP